MTLGGPPREGPTHYGPVAPFWLLPSLIGRAAHAARARRARPWSVSRGASEPRLRPAPLRRCAACWRPAVSPPLASLAFGGWLELCAAILVRLTVGGLRAYEEPPSHPLALLGGCFLAAVLSAPRRAFPLRALRRPARRVWRSGGGARTLSLRCGPPGGPGAVQGRRAPLASPWNKVGSACGPRGGASLACLPDPRHRHVCCPSSQPAGAHHCLPVPRLGRSRRRFVAPFPLTSRAPPFGVLGPRAPPCRRAFRAGRGSAGPPPRAPPRAGWTPSRLWPHFAPRRPPPPALPALRGCRPVPRPVAAALRTTASCRTSFPCGPCGHPPAEQPGLSAAFRCVLSYLVSPSTAS